MMIIIFQDGPDHKWVCLWPLWWRPHHQQVTPLILMTQAMLRLGLKLNLCPKFKWCPIVVRHTLLCYFLLKNQRKYQKQKSSVFLLTVALVNALNPGIHIFHFLPVQACWYKKLGKSPGLKNVIFSRISGLKLSVSINLSLFLGNLSAYITGWLIETVKTKKSDRPKTNQKLQ